MAELELRKNATVKAVGALAIWAVAASVASELSAIAPFECLSIIFFLSYITTLCRLNVRSIFKPRKRFFVLGSVLMFCNQFFYLAAFHFAAPEKIELIYYTWPIMFFLLTPYFENKPLQYSYLAACLIGTFGVYVLLSQSLQFDGFNPNELLFPLICALSWALYIHLSKKERLLQPEAIGLFFGILFPIVLAVHLLFEPFVIPTLREAVLLLFMGVVIMGFSYSWWEEGIRFGKTKELTLLAFFNPVWSVAVLILLGKTEAKPELFYALGIILVATALPKIARRAKRVVE